MPIESLNNTWFQTKLGDILELKYGKSLPAKNRDGIGAPVYGSNGIVGNHSVPIVDKVGIVVGRKGSFGEVNLSLIPFSPIDTTYFVDELYGQPIKYWYYQLKYLPLTQLNRSTAIPGLNRDDAYSQEIKLPPLSEQKQIAAKLDELLAQVDTLKTRLDTIPTILKRFRQSVLASAVSGKLTEDWRKENNIVEQAGKTLAEVIDKLDQGWSPKCINKPVKDTQWGVIKTSSVQMIKFISIENKLLPESLTARPNLNLLKNDILITRAGPRVRCGVTCIVDRDYPNLMICDKVYRIRVDETKVKPMFLTLLLNSPQYLEQIEMLKTGISESGMNLTQKKFNNMIALFPLIEEQTEIVRQVEQLFNFADKIEQRVKKAQSKVNNLTQSILAKAFRGELTSEWRKQNPELISGERSAKALLEKIKAERERLLPKKQSAKKKTRRKSKVKA